MPGTETASSQPFDSFVHALSRTERQLLMLFYAEELTTTEISLVLDLAETRVQSMLDGLRYRARRVIADRTAATA